MRLPIFTTGRLARRYASQTRSSQGWRMNLLWSSWKTAPVGFSHSRPGMRSTTTISWRTSSAVFRPERPRQSLRRPFVARGLSAGSKAESVITSWNSAGIRTGQRHTIKSRCVGVRNTVSSQQGQRGCKAPACRKAIPCMDKPCPATSHSSPGCQRASGTFLFILLLNAYCFRIRKV